MTFSTFIKLLVVGLFILSIFYVHFRGRARLPFLRQMFNYSALFAPYNSLMYLFSATPSQPVVKRDDFKELDLLRDNWEIIREEGEKLFDEGYIRDALHNNEAGFGSFFKKGWTRFYVTWYHGALPSAQKLCPKTLELVKRIPSVKGAMFTRLPAHSHLNPHRDPFGGSLRYHLGLATPNSEACSIYVDDQKLTWYDGKDFMFDETYVHWVKNDTDNNRLIFFCDVERPLPQPMQSINRAVSSFLASATAPQNVEGERVGWINSTYSIFIRISKAIGVPVKKLKRRSRLLYRLLQAVLVVFLLWVLYHWVF